MGCSVCVCGMLKSVSDGVSAVMSYVAEVGTFMSLSFWDRSDRNAQWGRPSGERGR